MRILPRAQREAMFEIYSFCRRSTTSPTDAGPRDRRGSSSSQRWRADIDALYAGTSSPRAARARAAGAALRPAGARISSPSSTAWRWTCSRTSARRTARRSISIATASRARSAGSRCGCSAWRRRPASRSRIISAARCSSPTSCATSTRTPAIGRLYLPREALAGRGHHDHRSGGRAGAARASARPARRSSRARASISPKPTRSWRAVPRRSVRAPRIMGEAYRVDPRRLVARGWRRAAPAGEGVRAAPVLDHPALRVHLMPRTVHIIGAGLAGLSAAVRLAARGEHVVVHEATAQAGGRCRSYHDAALGHDHRQRQSSAAVRQSRGAGLSRRRSARRTGLVGPPQAEFAFIDLPSGERWTLRINDGRLPWWIFDAGSRVPGTTRDATISGCCRCCGRGKRQDRRRRDRLQRAALRPAAAAAAARRAQYRPAGGLGARSPARSCARRCWRAAAPAGR